MHLHIFRGAFKTYKYFSDNLRDPSPIFFSSQVQKLLKELTSVDIEKVFEPKKLQQKPNSPRYQFMTSEELEKV